MAMKKAEMEASAQQYDSLLAIAKAAEAQGLYRFAIESAVKAWDHIDGMLQYAARYANSPVERIDAIEIVLKCAPLLFDFRRLNALEQLLDSRRRIEKTAAESVSEKLAAARAQMQGNHRLWSLFERHGQLRQDEIGKLLGRGADHWRDTLESWAAMGLVDRVPLAGSFRVTLNTRMGHVVRAKCPSCGKIAEAPKSMFLEMMKCPECGVSVSFVLLAKIGKRVD